MSVLDWSGLALAAVLLVYLLFALLRAEHF